VQLADLREASILHNLRERFAGGDIYTKIGTILVSVNPFQVMDIYTAEILEAYARSAEAKAADGTDVLPPHVYQVADMAYRDMVSDGTPQACLVSGESGAGKTEATKVMLHFLAEMSAKRASEDWGEQSRLQDQILKANPLMEAFGNAKTVRNSNSSRFGKYIEVRFNSRQGTIIGGAVTQYLLEKSRIVYQSKGERNYHIFYQLCAGGHIDPELRKRHRVTDIDQYRYLFDADASVGINDERGWEETMHAMEALGMSTAERDDVVRTVAGVLHLGNITFVEKKVTGVDQACEVVREVLPAVHAGLCR
jgi:myosin heavy subunit